MTELHLDLLLPDAVATETLGAALARALAPAGRGAVAKRESPMTAAAATRGFRVLYLQGELGAGKTTCVRSLLRTLGVEGAIRSPTYTLVEVYELAAIICVHVDLYRLQGPTELDELGLRDYLDGDCLMLVEWPEKGGAALAPADVELTFNYHDKGRLGSLKAYSAPGRQWLDKLALETSLTPYVSNLT